MLKAGYDDMFHDIGVHGARICKNWVKSIKEELFRIGLGEYWLLQYVPDVKTFMQIVKQRLLDIFIQECHACFDVSNKCLIYKHLVDTFCLQHYLKKQLNSKLKSVIFKVRTSSHMLNVELGRFNDVPRNLRLCTLCDHSTMEDEFHFILVCPVYVDLRIKFIKPYYFRKPSMYKLIQLLNVTSTKWLSNLGKYLNNAFKRRSQML